jgi:proteasome lid subunit RPN8/RPN11
LDLEISNLLAPIQEEQIRAIGIAEHELNREACGFILSDGEVYQCENLSQSPEVEFIIDSKLYASKERKPGISMIFHSHCNGNDKFTAADVDLIHRTQKPLILYDTHRNDFKIADPSGNTPLLGRFFLYGIYDCFSIVRDYYKRERGIELLNYSRSSDRAVWDETEWDIIDVEYEKAGFKLVKQPEQGDLLAMSIGSNVKGINHLAVYLGDDKFIHQLSNRKSCIDIWGSPWSEYCIKYLRFFGND